jgi:hypothetical protein
MRRSGTVMGFVQSTTDTDGNVTLVEVKSLTEANATAQPRTGLGQLLDYADHFRDRPVRRVLRVERAPGDKARWRRICEEAGVILAWPGQEARVFSPFGHSALRVRNQAEQVRGATEWWVGSFPISPSTGADALGDASPVMRPQIPMPGRLGCEP